MSLRIAVVGPAPPFRSGVAKHTGALAVELASRADVRLFSFSRQYPSFLFPGDDDRAPGGAPLAHPPTDYGLDSVNPLTWSKVAARLVDFAPDLVVVPVWTFFTAPCLASVVGAARRRGARVVAVVHNAADHEAAAWKRAALNSLLRLADAAVTHNQALADDVRAVCPSIPIVVSPHPVFDDPPARGQLARRAALEVLMFGIVRPYKGADLLVDAVARLPDLDVQVSIVGEFWGGESDLRAQIAAVGLAERIEIVSRYVSDQEASEYFARADLVALPYRHVTGSGVAPLAIRHGRPVIAADLPGFREIVQHGRTGWLFPAGDPAALAACLCERAALGDAAALRPQVEAAAADFTWPAFADAVLRAEAHSRRRSAA